MKCLSLLQPYASAIIVGPKRVENRPRTIFNVPADGVWIGIHSSKGWWDIDWSLWRRDWPEASMLQRDYPRGVVLGAAHVVSRRVYDEAVPVETIAADLGAWAFGPVCYVLDNVVALPEPMPCKGALGLWAPPAEIGRMLDQLVGGAT